LRKEPVYYLLVVFSIGCLIRLAPVVVSFPYPVGYDTINYYLPTLYHFESNWEKLITEFPIYIALVYLFSLVSPVDIYYSFLISTVLLYGFFSATVYLLSKKIMKQTSNMSLVFTVFVIFQLGTLRVSWDLFRDLFSLILFNFFLLLINNIKEKNNITHPLISIVTVFSISIVTVFSDRMIGILLIIVSFIFSFVYKQKYLFMINAFFAFSFLFYFFAFDKITFISNHADFLNMLLNPLYDKNAFSKLDMSVLFLSLYGILMPLFIPGFFSTKLNDHTLVIKIPLIITAIFSFTWIFVPNYGYIVPERWMLVFGIYMSLIAVSGFFSIMDNYLVLRKGRIRKEIIFFFLFAFIIYGFLFAVMPYNVTYSLPSFFKENTMFIIPFSMIFNTLDINDNHDLLKAIDWINSNTTNDSTIIGTKHSRGWFSLFLNPTRHYLYVEDFVGMNDTPLNKKQTNNFLLSLEKKFAYLCDHKNNHKHNTFLYFLDFDKSYDAPLFSSIVYHSENIVIYDLKQPTCDFKSLTGFKDKMRQNETK
jgi:hypothetical protein